MTSAREYLAQEVAFDRAKASAYLMHGLATIFDLMRDGQWRQAEAITGLLLAAGEQSTMDNGRWTLGWLYTHLPEPPWQRIQRRPTENPMRPYSRLLEPRWAAAAAAYTKDMAALSELRKRGDPGQRGAGEDGDKGSKPKGGAPNGDK